uniref:Uncharacterized protein n=1 Tax=viral metagenome TaxID=1070528 RepID=A0A6M3JIV5_9ZZZZ
MSEQKRIDALAAALHDTARPRHIGMLPDLTACTGSAVHEEDAAAILAALDGWTLVRKTPYIDEDEHGRQSAAGSHLCDEGCPYCAEAEIDRLREIEEAARAVSDRDPTVTDPEGAGRRVVPLLRQADAGP